MRAAGALAALTAVLAGCGLASPDPGYDALIQVPGAQLRPGPFPGDEGGPEVTAVQNAHATVVPGTVGEPYHGALAAGATAVIVGVDGDDAAWIVPAGLPEIDTPDYPSFDIRAGFSGELPPGPFTLDFAAVDATGRIGPTARVDLVADQVSPPDGELVVTLSWQGPADLDLHVVDPDGGEAWAGDPNTWDPPPPGTPVDPDAWKAGGILDHDANARCVVDGAPREDVIWTMPPPSGDYVVRVDAQSMCGAAIAYWYVAAYRAGDLVGAAQGVATPDDVQQPHGSGAGVTALRFSLP